MTRTAGVVHLTPASFVAHPLHADERMWPETNCYVDLWIEVLHALRLDPVAGLAFLGSVDFDGEQWEFFKYAFHDLRVLYGIEVGEVNIWQPLEEHIERHLRLGHLLTVDVDSFHLPDTVGVSYQLTHQKSSVVPVWIDREAATMGYLHNRAYAELGSDDFGHIFREVDPDRDLPPYVERIGLGRLERHDDDRLRELSRELFHGHLLAGPQGNPVARMLERLEADLGWLATGGVDVFHAYAFGTVRLLGAWAELASTYVAWLLPGAGEEPAARFHDLSAAAKTIQFKLARIANGRSADIGSLRDQMVQLWEEAVGGLGARLG